MTNTEGQTIVSGDTGPAPTTEPDSPEVGVGITHNAEVISPTPAPPQPIQPNEAQLGAQIQTELQEGLADTLGVAKEIVAAGAAYYAPMLARQAILQTSSDPAVKAKADGHWRHLRGQFLMEAASKGIPLQQRNEERVLNVLTVVLSIAMRALTGGVA